MIEYLNINGEEIPVRINRKSIILFERKFKKGLADLGSIGLEELSFLLYLGVCEGYKFLEEDNPFKKFEAFESKLDEMDLSDFLEKGAKVISDFFTKKKEK
ncbi:hypothetical protein KI659_17960 [Litoribacter alkaliphilus]|uniref:Uncharacterized protein n=1 Tax=Litoribacter ruber TaxID=702568 RepID=A0AAP2CM86_9BACT|nr:hypothetical protein [Litoribacter alkaliphilus]MBS9525911.1 hypothetical protein [Litoribacter alkaliphilus]